MLQIAAGVAALAILGAGWFVANSLSSRASDLEQSTAQAVAIADRDAQIREQHADLTTRVKAAQLAVAEAQSRLGDSPQESRFIAQLTDLSEEAGLNVSNVQPGATTVHGSVGILELKMSCDGTYEGLCSFLTALDKLPRICHVSGMNTSSIDSQTGELRIDLQLQLLFALPAPQATKPGGPA